MNEAHDGIRTAVYRDAPPDHASSSTTASCPCVSRGGPTESQTPSTSGGRPSRLLFGVFCDRFVCSWLSPVANICTVPPLFARLFFGPAPFPLPRSHPAVVRTLNGCSTFRISINVAVEIKADAAFSFPLFFFSYCFLPAAVESQWKSP